MAARCIGKEDAVYCDIFYLRRKNKSFLRSKSSKAKAAEKESKGEAQADQDSTPADDMSYQQDPLLNHPHFKKIKDLNEGTFGFVQLARDTRRDEPVRPFRWPDMFTLPGH